MGNGNCDYENFESIQRASASLVSLTYATYFFMGLTSIVGVNYVGAVMLNGYLQIYSANYYINGSVVMETDSVLADYREININAFYNLNLKD